MSLDKNSQPKNTGFNYSRNVERAAYCLKGILEGVAADGRLNEQELLFLDVWLRSEEHLKKDGDVVDLLDLIGEVIQDGVITENELTEVHSLIDDIINYKQLDVADYSCQINELLGLLSGIAADDKIQELEVAGLQTWLSKNPEIKDVWPANVILERLDIIFKDNFISEDEKTDLLETIKQITGVRFSESGIAHGVATEFFEDFVDVVEHDGACFCFSGTFVSGTRSAIEQRAQARGASVKNNVTKSVDYLVIGTLASRDWKFTNHGRKIEQALKLKMAGHPITIITERTWIRYG